MKYEFENLGETFCYILYFYSCVYNFSTSSISMTTSNPFNINFNLETIPHINDPLTENNSAKSCYKILEIQERLFRIFSDLMNLKKKFQEEDEYFNYSKNSTGKEKEKDTKELRLFEKIFC